MALSTLDPNKIYNGPDMPYNQPCEFCLYPGYKGDAHANLTDETILVVQSTTDKYNKKLYKSYACCSACKTALGLIQVQLTT
jgi:hypothetical protein